MIRLSKRYRNLMTHKVEETSVIFVFEFDRAKTGEYLKQLLIVSNRSVASDLNIRPNILTRFLNLEIDHWHQ